MRGYEVFQRVEPFLEVRRDRVTDDAARRVGHESADTRHLRDLSAGASSSRVDHYPEGVGEVHALHDLVGDAASSVGPEDILLAHVFVLGHDTHFVLRGEVFFLHFGYVEYLAFLLRDYNVADAEADAADGRPVVAERLYRVEHLYHAGLAHFVVGFVKQLAHFFLIDYVVFVAEAGMQRAVEEHAARSCLYPLAVDGVALPLGGLLEHYLRVDVDELVVERREDVVHVAEVHAFALHALAHRRQVVDAEDDVLRRRDDRLAARRGEQVVRGEHEDARLGLRFERERDVDGHLVSVEVRVEGRADERMEAYRLSFYKHRLKGLDAEAVKRRRAVEHDGMVLDDVLEDSPHFVASALDEAARALDVRRKPALDELVHDEGLEELERHLLRKTALVYLEVRADDDDGTSGVVDALSEQVLAEAAFLSPQQVGEALERTVARAEHRFAAAAVVYQRIYGLLEHTFFVAHDYLGRAELLELAETVVAVDDAAVEVVEVRRGEASAVELDHRAKVRRDDGKDGEHHPFGARVALAEILGDLEALYELALLLSRALGDLFAELVDERVDVYLVEQRVDALGSDAGLEVRVIGGAESLLALEYDVAALKRRIAAVDDYVARIFYRLALLGGLEALGIFLRVEARLALGDDVVLRERKVDDGRDDVGFLVVEDGAICLELRIALKHDFFLRLGDHLRSVDGFAFLIYSVRRLDLEEVVAEVAAEASYLRRRYDVAFVDGNVLDSRDAEGLFGLELRVVEAVDALLRSGHERTAAREVYPAPFVDYLIYLFAAARRREVDDLLEVLRRGAEQQAEAARDAAQIPDMHDGSRELDVPHSFAAHAVVGDFDAAALADDAAEFRAAALIFSAGAFVAPDGAEYALAEKAVLLRPERPVVDRLRLFDFPAGEFPDPLRGRKSHSYSGDFMAYVSH